ncbi:MAG: hypothetical protein IPH07_13000 [Deltaproteobacteria bacterium]|nr:hypothetical protein [Deltaproteobacteria bacterium]MBK8717010.1 hypothetical protein [Deltaproteobacteria bacterium]
MTDDATEHWLWRLDAAAWLAAARRELAAAQEQLESRRACVAHARRAGGMACNAVLCAWAQREPERADAIASVWGRSYVEHLRWLAMGETGPLPVQVAPLAKVLLETPMAAPEVIGLGAQRHADLRRLMDATDALVTACADFVRTP